MAGEATQRTYTWIGVDRQGIAHQGRTGLTPEQMAAKVEHHYGRGWRWLQVAEGWDPPDDSAELAAAIDREPGTGRRRWWAGVDAEPEAGS